MPPGPVHRLFRRVLAAFLSRTVHIPLLVLDNNLPNPLKFIIHLSSYRAGLFDALTEF